VTTTRRLLTGASRDAIQIAQKVEAGGKPASTMTDVGNFILRLYQYNHFVF